MMTYLVMENHESHSIVIDENGMFYRVANLGYEVGDTVTDPIFMKTPETKKKSKPGWKKISTIAAIFVCLLLSSIPFISNNTQSDVLVYMSINPEIHLELNEDGKINKLVADNEDGKILLEGYSFRGKSVSNVLVELIDRAELLEYLSEGGDIRITVESESNDKAETMQVGLSEILKETYVKKYLIKIKANQDEFIAIEDVLNKSSASSSEMESVTSESETAVYYYATEHYTNETAAATENSTASTTLATTESSKETTKATENTKPVNKPTEKPTVVTQSTEATTASTEASSETEPSSEIEGDDGDEEDDDFYWPWWPWPAKDVQ